jgi:hypothetical protein
MRPDLFYGWGITLLDNLPKYWEEDDFMQQWMMALGFEFDVLDRFTAFMSDEDIRAALGSNLPNDLEPMHSAWFVRTANDDALELWEDMLGSPSDTTYTRQDRVAGLITKMQITATPTPAYIKSQIEQYADELEVIEYFNLPGNDINRYTFGIRIIQPKGFPPNVATNIDLMIKRIKPSHLGYTIIYSESSWAALGNRTWNDIGNVTWADMGY